MGCSGRADSLPELETSEILNNSAESMANLAGFRFDIDRDGQLAYLDSDRTLAFGSAIGDYVSPDRARAQVNIIGPGFVTKVNVISVGDIQWETNVISGVWTELPPNWGFNPTAIFDPVNGLQAILTEDTISAQQEEASDMDGDSAELLYVVSGELKGERVYQLSGFLIGPDALTYKLWIDPVTFNLVRVLITDPPSENSEDENTLWQIDFSNFDQVIEIEPPNLEPNK